MSIGAVARVIDDVGSQLARIDDLIASILGAQSMAAVESRHVYIRGYIDAARDGQVLTERERECLVKRAGEAANARLAQLRCGRVFGP